ncbi:MAG: DMT family transporter [Rhizobiaceae bacterium]
MAAPGPETASPLTGIALKIASVAVFVAMMTCIKATGPLPPGEIVFFRSAFAMVPVFAFLAWRRELASGFRTDRPAGHIARGLVGVTAMALGFFGLTVLPLPDAITISYAQPIVLTILSAIFLGETIRIFRWSAVAAGMLGVLIISWPKLSLLTGQSEIGQTEAFGVLAVLGSASLAAVAMILVRKLIETETTVSIVVWFSVTATVASLFTIPFGWEALSAQQTALLIGSGICGGVAQLLMTQAYRHAPLSTVAPFDYTSMLLGIAAGYVFFADIPTGQTLFGGSIVVAAGLFIIWREHRLGIKRKGARRVMSPQG